MMKVVRHWKTARDVAYSPLMEASEVAKGYEQHDQ